MDVITVDRRTYLRSASRITVLAHLLGLTALVLLIFWLLHYREGLDLDSENPSRVFNVKFSISLNLKIYLALLTSCILQSYGGAMAPSGPYVASSLVHLFAAEAMMVYKTIPAEHQVQKFVHLFFNLVSLVLGIVGIHAVFKYHDKLHLEDMTSLHSWIGMWLFGFSFFLFSQASTVNTRARALPWHVNGGRALLYMAICAAETGLMQKATYLRLGGSRESHLMNVLGVLILLFGITVDISVALARCI
uniref:Cytochrome b561 domain-containing protein n=1 Tax=Daucus carota subsp. sativus TaxID=79200 RepID=A0A175YRH7_DAUCS